MSKAFISATKFKVTINKAALLQEVTAGRNGKVTGVQIRKYIYPIMEEARKDLVRDFHSHSITQEIKSGPSASNNSGTLGGYGNLFSFIGFSQGDSPTIPIENILNQRLNVKVRAVGGGKFRITIMNAPSAQAIFNVTPIPWASGSSWAEGMEKGISNLGSFLYRESGVPSRSGTGIQVKNPLRTSNLRTGSYISGIMDKFLRNVTKF
jgi:hypothetical protein